MRRVRDPRLLVLVSAALLGAAIAFPLGAIASHQFTDVPNSNTFHADIDALADAGVTSGCAAGKYCPKDFVTREQMAAFLNRLGALGPGKVPVVNADRVDGLNSTQFARSDVAVAGRYNCMGKVMSPDTFSNVVFVGQAIGLAGGPGQVSCQVHLPDGATVTELSATLFDHSFQHHGSCRLQRADRTDNDPGSFMATTVDTGALEQPDLVTSTDTTINDATIDNELYVYDANCVLSGGGGDVTVIGVSVAYTVTGLPVE
jgi:hypothetical protein